MTDAPVTYAVLWSRELAAEALNERRMEIGMAMRELDNAMCKAEGTAAKYLSPSRTKNLGLESFFHISRSLGLRVVLEVDPKAAAKAIEERRPRRATQARDGNHAQRLSNRVVARVQRHFGKLSAPSRMKKITAKMRSVIARHAAICRHYPDRVYDWDAIKAAADSPNAVIKANTPRKHPP